MKKVSFESAMKDLDEIVDELESGSLSLDESLKKFEKGVELSRFCKQKLDESELKIKQLVKIEDEFELKDAEL